MPVLQRIESWTTGGNKPYIQGQGDSSRGNNEYQVPDAKNELNTFSLRGETKILGIDDHTRKLVLKPKYLYSKHISLPQGMKNQDVMCMHYIVYIKSNLPTQILSEMKYHKSHVLGGVI